MQAMVSAKVRFVQTAAVLVLITALSIALLPPVSPEVVYSTYTMQSRKTETPYYVTRIHIWNAGRTALGGDSSPLFIRVADPGDVFYFQISDRPPPENGFVLDRLDASGMAALHYAHMRPGDDVSVALYTHVPAKITLHESAQGMPIRQQQKDPAPLLLSVFTAFTALLVSACLYALLRAIARTRREASGAPSLPRLWPLPIDTPIDYTPRRSTRPGRFLQKHWPAALGLIWLVCWLLMYA